MSTSGAEQLSPSCLQKHLMPDDYQYLTEDKYRRFISQDPYVAYLLLSKSADGGTVAQQIDLPIFGHPYFLNVKNLKKVWFNTTEERTKTVALTQDNKMMFESGRSLKVSVAAPNKANSQYELIFFSPFSEYPTQQNIHVKLQQHRCCDSACKLCDESQVEIKGGSLNIRVNDILNNHSMPRDNFPRRTAMGRSALKAYEDFYATHKSCLSDSMKTALKQSIKAGNPYSPNPPMHAFKRPEWCHALARQFHPVDVNPDRIDNKGAAPFWLNSQMFVVESVLKWHAKTYPDANIRLASHFYCFKKSDIIQSSEMIADIERAQSKVTLYQFINSHQLYPNYPQVTDVALATFVVNGLLHFAPLSSVEIDTSALDPLALSKSTFYETDKLLLKDEEVLDKICLERDLEEIVNEHKKRKLLHSIMPENTSMTPSEVNVSDPLLFSEAGKIRHSYQTKEDHIEKENDQSNNPSQKAKSPVQHRKPLRVMQ